MPAQDFIKMVELYYDWLRFYHEQSRFYYKQSTYITTGQNFHDDSLRLIRLDILGILLVYSLWYVRHEGCCCGFTGFWWKWIHSQDESRYSVVRMFAVRHFCSGFLNGEIAAWVSRGMFWAESVGLNSVGKQTQVCNAFKPTKLVIST